MLQLQAGGVKLLLTCPVLGQEWFVLHHFKTHGSAVSKLARASNFLEAARARILQSSAICLSTAKSSPVRRTAVRVPAVSPPSGHGWGTSRRVSRAASCCTRRAWAPTANAFQLCASPTRVQRVVAFSPVYCILSIGIAVFPYMAATHELRIRLDFHCKV